MINKPTLLALNAAGEALKALGERHVTMTYDAIDDVFSVSVPSTDNKRWSDTYGHAATPLDAYQIACAKRAEGAAKAARKERILRRAEELEAAEEAGEHREAA